MGLIGPQGPPGIVPTDVALTDAANTFVGGDQTVNGNLVLTGSGNGIVFPDGTKQSTSSAAPAVPSGFMILGNSPTPPAGYTFLGVLGGSNQWSQGANIDTALSKNSELGLAKFGAAALKGQIYAVGGVTKKFGSISPIGDVETWDGLSDGWNSVASLPYTTDGLAAVGASDPAGPGIYIMGGSNDTSPVSSVLAVYNPTTNTWSGRSGMPTGRSRLAAVVVTNPNGSQRFWALGGIDAQSQSLSTVEAYRIDFDNWTSIGSMLTPRADFAAAEANGNIYVFGGVNTNATAGCLDTAEVFSFSTGGWRPIAKMPNALGSHAAVSYGGKIYVMGGKVGCSGAPTPGVSVYDPATDTWSSAPLMGTARSNLVAVVSGGRILAIGGFDATGTPIGTVEVFSLPVYMFVKN